MNDPCDLPIVELGRPSRTAPALAFRRGKGHLSVNPVAGCTLMCPFCIGRGDSWSQGASFAGLRPLSTVPRILETLEAHADRVRPLKLSIMDFTEPFLVGNQRLLDALLRGLDERLPGQAVLLTTRLHPGEPFLDLLAGLKRLKLSLFVSLGDATGGVRPVTPVWQRLKLLEDSSDRGLHTVMLLRPLVREWSRASALRFLLGHAAATCHEVVLSGLSLRPEVEAGLSQAGWPVPRQPSDEHGGVEPGFALEVMALAEKVLGQVPLSEHRSCAMNRHHRLPCLVAWDAQGSAKTLDGGEGAQPELGARPSPDVSRCRLDTEARGLTVRACRCFADLDDRPMSQTRADRRPRDAQGYCLMRRAA